MSEFLPPFTTVQDAFGVPAVVTRPAPDDTPIETVVVWVAPLPEEVPIGGQFQRQEPRRIVALALAEVPSVPRGTQIVAAETTGLDEQTWQVDGTERREVDHVRVIVVQVESES